MNGSAFMLGRRRGSDAIGSNNRRERRVDQSRVSRMCNVRSNIKVLIPTQVSFLQWGGSSRLAPALHRARKELDAEHGFSVALFCLHIWRKEREASGYLPHCNSATPALNEARKELDAQHDFSVAPFCLHTNQGRKTRPRDIYLKAVMLPGSVYLPAPLFHSF